MKYLHPKLGLLFEAIAHERRHAAHCVVCRTSPRGGRCGEAVRLQGVTDYLLRRVLGLPVLN